MLARFALAALLLTTTSALAGDGASPPPPPAPSVDFSDLGPEASKRPKNGDGSPHQLHARLLTDVNTVKPGDSFRAGLHFEQDPHWHTYWKSPGEIGLPTDVSWTLPDGFSTTTVGVLGAEYEYPVPQRFEDPDAGIISAGYDGETLVYSTIQVPTSTEPGTYEIALKGGWLICKTSCIPGEVTLKTSVTVADATAPSPYAAVLDHYGTRHPVDPATVEGVAFETAMSQSAVRPYDKLTFKLLVSPTGDSAITSPAEAELPAFFPYASMASWYMERPTIETLEDGRILVTLTGEAISETLPENDRMGGLFQLKVGDEWIRTEVTMPVPWAAEGSTVEPTGGPLFELGAPPTAEAGTDPTAKSGTTPSATGKNGPKPGLLASAPPSPASSGSLPGMLLFAFIGGAILNIMPCVFPVLTMKLFGLVSHSDEDSSAQKRSGLAYTAGIVVSFWALAAGVLMLKASAGTVGWGFQMQSPTYVAGLATVVFAFGLSLFGVFEVPAFGADSAAGAADKEGLVGDFFNGVFATLIATPCTAPFLGPAVGFAFGQSAPVIVLFFTVIGLGLASPFLLVAFVPAIYGLLPQPGAWMVTFKQFMGFTLIATTVWMVDILAAQIGTDSAIGFLAFLTTVALASWVFGTWGGLAETRQRQGVAALAAAGVMVLGGWAFVDLDFSDEQVCDDGAVTAAGDLDYGTHIPWQPFTEARVNDLAGSLVFIDFTAEWCLSCKVNEQTVLETATVREAMAKHDVVALKGDWTRKDPVITEWLTRFGRAGVPFYLVITADGEFIPLPEVLTTGIVLDAIKR